MAYQFVAYQCSLCKVVSDSAPLLSCPLKHHRFCSDCYKDLQKNCLGNRNGQIIHCPRCELLNKFETSTPANILRHLFGKTRIERPFSVRPNIYGGGGGGGGGVESGSGECHSLGDSTIAALQMCDTTNPKVSRKPLVCHHRNCHIHVAISKLMAHFKYDHPDVVLFNRPRGEELALPFDVAAIEHGLTVCIAMLTVHETNQIDVGRSRSSISVIKVCEKLSGKVPLNTFWLMVTGSKDDYRRKNGAYAAFWVYSNCIEPFWCSIELAAKNNRISVAAFCQAVCLHEDEFEENVVKNMKCLYVSRGSLFALLIEDSQLMLKLYIH